MGSRRRREIAFQGPASRTASGNRMPYARLIHGTLRKKSRCSDSTRGAVSEREALKPIVFWVELRMAIMPVEAPVAIRLAMTPQTAA
jgi:hypothetical protein